jgi:hypothetical protein
VNRRAAYVYAVATTAFVVAALAAPAAPAAATRTGLPVQLWGIEVDRTSVGLLTPERLRQLRRSGTNALIADPSRMSAHQLSRVRAAAKRWRLTLVIPAVAVAPAANGPADAAAACRALKQENGAPCTVTAPSLAFAQASAGFEDIDVVVVRLGSPAEVRRVGDSLASSTPAARLVVLPPLRGATRAWRAAIAAVERNLAVDIAVTPSGARKDATLRRYLNVLRSARVALTTKRAYRGPGRPARVSVIGVSGRSVALRWSRTAGKTRSVGFVLFRSATAVGATRAGSATFYGLRCGTTNLLGVAAVDRRGNRSRVFYVSAPTASCETGQAGYGAHSPGEGPDPLSGSLGTGGGAAPGHGGGAAHPAPGSSAGPAAPPLVPAGPPGTLPFASVAPWGVEANPCTQALPCASFNRAYRAAASGGVVQIAGGTYPGQIITEDPSKTGAPVTFEPAAGALVTVSGMLDVGQDQFLLKAPRNIVLRNLRATNEIRIWSGASGITVENADANNFLIVDASDITIRGGDFGPCVAGPGVSCVSKIAGPLARNIVVEDALFHDISSSNPDLFHIECMFLRSGTNVTIRRNKFRNCEVFDIFLQAQPEVQKFSSISIENNWFDAPLTGDGRRRTTALSFSGPATFENLTVRYNSFASNAGILFDAENVLVNARVVANTLQYGKCSTNAGLTFAYNVFVPFSAFTGQTPCGKTDKKVASFGYVDPGGFDFHLAPGSPALGAGVPGECPSNDIDGQARSSPCDAGSDER